MAITHCTNELAGFGAEHRRPKISVGRIACAAIGIVALTLSGCGGSGSASTTESLAQEFSQHSDADLSGAQVIESSPGSSPFIERLTVSLSNVSQLVNFEFIIHPKAGSVSKAVDVRYSRAALTERGYIAEGSPEILLPVFGLYAGYANQVSLNLGFQDGSTRTLTTSILTADYTDPTGIYQHPTILMRRSPESSLGFDFFYIKSALESPVVIDTDGEIRWAVAGPGNAMSTALQGDEFVIGDPAYPIVHRLRLDGTATQGPLASTPPAAVDFSHNIDFGNLGLLADVDTKSNGVENIDSTVLEITDQGTILQRWDLGAILSAYMQSQGDDPSTFVRPGVDWVHINASTYDPSDNSVIISSRENFVIKLDYETGRIIWIFGDPTKYWYTFPSLRAKALTLAPGGLYPIGQHAISITQDGLLMLFNDGEGSLNEPAGQPAGQSRAYSAVSAYSINSVTMSAQNAWNFDDGQTIDSSFCSSAYEASEQSLLVDYAEADNDTHARLIGLDSNRSAVFDFEYPTQECNTSWNAVPIPLDSLIIN